MGLGRRSTKRKKTTQQGLIMAAMGSLGVHAMNATQDDGSGAFLTINIKI